MIERGRCYFLSYLYKHEFYNDSFREINDGETSNFLFTSRYLEEKISKKFTDRIHILQSNNKKVVAPKGITTIDDSLLTHLKDLDILKAVLLQTSILRNEIIAINKSNLPDSLNSKPLI